MRIYELLENGKVPYTDCPVILLLWDTEYGKYQFEHEFTSIGSIPDSYNVVVIDDVSYKSIGQINKRFVMMIKGIIRK